MLSSSKACGSCLQRVFSHDVTAAILVSQNNETAAMLVSQTSPLGVELFSYANAFFCYNKFAYMLATWVKTLYCVVPGNIHTPPRRVTEIPRGGGGVEKEATSDGWGVSYREFFGGAPSKIGELLKTSSWSVEQAISYLTVNSLLKQYSYCFHRWFLFMIGWMLFSWLTRWIVVIPLTNKLPVI